MVLQYSPGANTLYLRLRAGEVAETAEDREDVYVDLDAEGRPVGVEFLDAERVFSFIQESGAANGVVDVEAAVRSILDERFDVPRRPSLTDPWADRAVLTQIGHPFEETEGADPRERPTGSALADLVGAVAEGGDAARPSPSGPHQVGGLGEEIKAARRSVAERDASDSS